ncbi:hypothetical protein Scep_019807 [Stephania cephalantha]|uniref:ENTH domain-containing protein n=1 Tax=Stephania cephalantha TaxID=152367 RepID=A0AAP0IBK7_9MAGN
MDRLHTTRDASIVLSSVSTISSPPHQNHMSAVLSYGFASRATSSLCIHALMDRLHTTRDASVAFKCLITVHNIIKRGSFILQDQLSVCPKYGGKTSSPSVNITSDLFNTQFADARKMFDETTDKDEKGN